MDRREHDKARAEMVQRLLGLRSRVEGMAQIVYDERDSWPSFDDETRVRLDEYASQLTRLGDRLNDHAETVAATYYGTVTAKKVPAHKPRKRMR